MRYPVTLPIEGACFCGAVRFRLMREPMFVSCCHCSDCRRQSGAAFAMYAAVEAVHLVRLTGAPMAVRLRTDAGTLHETFRCPVCHAPVWDDYGVPGVRFARVSALDQAGTLTPDVHIFTRSKLPWVRLPDGVPAFSGDCDMLSLYPPESRARRLAATTDADANTGVDKPSSGA